MKLPDPSSPPLQQALDCARLASLAYEPGTKLTGLPHATQWRVDNDHGFVAGNDQCIVIAIAGTDDIGDWWDNVRMNWLGCARNIWEVLQTHKLREDVPWYLTGHSRGGGLCQHLCGFLPVASTCITFGTPRTTKNYQPPGQMTSYVLPGDPVPLLPFHSRGWRDPANRIYLHESGADDEWPLELYHAAVNAVKFAVQWRLFGRNEAMAWVRRLHSMDRYVSRLEVLR